MTEDSLSLSILIRIGELTGWPICIVLISKLPSSSFSQIGMGLEFVPLEITFPQHKNDDLLCKRIFCPMIYL